MSSKSTQLVTRLRSVKSKGFRARMQSPLLNCEDGYEYDDLETGKITLETSGEDVKLHSKRVGKM